MTVLHRQMTLSRGRRRMSKHKCRRRLALATLSHCLKLRIPSSSLAHRKTTLLACRNQLRILPFLRWLLPTRRCALMMAPTSATTILVLERSQKVTSSSSPWTSAPPIRSRRNKKTSRTMATMLLRAMTMMIPTTRSLR